jgi:hypothetical protein
MGDGDSVEGPLALWPHAKYLNLLLSGSRIPILTAESES